MALVPSSTLVNSETIAAASSAALSPTTVESLYNVRRPEEVRPFLGAHPFLLPLLEEARGTIEQQFPGAPVYLQLLRDPEDPANSQLVASVATDLDPVDAFQRLQDLDASWWLAAMVRANGKLQISLEPL